MSNYDKYQQIYCLSSAANAIGDKTGTWEQLQQAEQTALELQLPAITQTESEVVSWRLRWGPCVYLPDGADAPTNVTYVAVNDDLQLCVVAVAGTAPASWIDWLGDADVGTTTPFDTWAQTWAPKNIPSPSTNVWPWPTEQLISSGTADFVDNILGTPAPLFDGVQAPGSYLGDYLQTFQNENSGYTIVFTGHSMGGAVVPVIALGLIRSNIIKHNDDYPVWVMPSAGPTPGNDLFNAAFRNEFTPSAATGIDYQSYNANFYNPLDIVPQAFSNTDSDPMNLDNIQTQIYSNLTTYASGLVSAGVDAAQIVADFVGYRTLQAQSFQHTPDLMPLSTLDWDQMKAEIDRQHTDAYWREIKIHDFVDRFNKTLLRQGLKVRKSPPPKSIEEARQTVESTRKRVEAMKQEMEKANQQKKAEVKAPEKVEIVALEDGVQGYE